MRFIVSLLSVFLLCLTMISSESAFAYKGKKTKMHRGYYSGVKFLTAKQIAYLAPAQRAQYIREYRKMFVDIERFQEAFHKANKKSKKNAGISPEKMQRFRDILFGSEANAADDDCDPTDPNADCATHRRGAQCADRCVYGYNLNYYTKNSAGQCVGFPFGCSKPPECSRGGSSKGFQCGESVSGLSGRDGCVSQSLVRGVTRSCEAKRVTLADQFRRSGDLDKLMASARAAFGLEGNGWNDDLLKSDKAKEIIDGLIATRYSDESYGMLIAAMEVYRRAGIPFPTENESVLKIGQNFAEMNDVIDNIFGDYMKMCNTPLAQDVVNGITDLENAATGTFNRRLEEARLEADRRRKAGESTAYCGITVGKSATEVAAARDQQNKQATSCNVLQVPQCFLVTQRMNHIKRVTDRLAASLPLNRSPNDTPPRVPPVPDAPPIEESVPVGCSDGGELNSSLIFNRYGRCALCSMEKAVHNIGDGSARDRHAPSRDGDRPTTGQYRVSTKWTALLSSMSKACGISNHGGSDVEQLNELIQTYGHCSGDTYGWDTADDYLRQGDIDKLQEWGNYNFWNGDGMPPERKSLWRRIFTSGPGVVPEPDMNNDFARIFGMSYAQATEIFCDPSRFKSPDFYLDQQRSGRMRIKKMGKKQREQYLSQNATPEARPLTSRERREYNRAKEQCKDDFPRGRDLHLRGDCEDAAYARIAGRQPASSTTTDTSRIQRRDAGRQRMEYALDNHYIKNEAPDGTKTAADGLERCLAESLNRAEELYGPDRNGTMCMKTVPLDPNTLKQQMTGPKPGNVIVADKDCMVGHQVTTRNDKGHTSLGMVSVDLLPEEALPAEGTEEFYNSAEPISAISSLARKSMTNNPVAAAARENQGLTIDMYLGYNQIRNTARFDEMTMQVSCNEYWSGRDYRVPGTSSSQGGNQ